MRIFLSRIWGFLRRGAVDRRLDEEQRFHLAMEAESNSRRGMPPAEALYAAHRAFGGAQQIREIYGERSGLPMLETFIKDLHYGLRMIRRSPGFTAIAVLSLALGIGANTAIFTLIDALLLRSLPVASPEQLVSVGDSSRPGGLSERQSSRRCVFLSPVFAAARPVPSVHRTARLRADRPDRCPRGRRRIGERPRPVRLGQLLRGARCGRISAAHFRARRTGRRDLRP